MFPASPGSTKIKAIWGADWGATTVERSFEGLRLNIKEEKGMSDKLSQQTCIPCSGKLPPATPEEIECYQREVPDWQLISPAGIAQIQRAYAFPNFAQALDFTNRVGVIAEIAGHHPALLTEWGKVTVTWWTHAINGLHQNDFIMAAKTDGIAAELNCTTAITD